MKILVVKKSVARKLRLIEFPNGNRLDPIIGWHNNIKIEWLPESIIHEETFSSAKKDLEGCSVVEINSITDEYYDSDRSVIIPVKEESDGIKRLRYFDKTGIEKDPYTLETKVVLK